MFMSYNGRAVNMHHGLDDGLANVACDDDDSPCESDSDFEIEDKDEDKYEDTEKKRGLDNNEDDIDIVQSIIMAPSGLSTINKNNININNSSSNRASQHKKRKSTKHSSLSNTPDASNVNQSFPLHLVINYVY